MAALDFHWLADVSFCLGIFEFSRVLLLFMEVAIHSGASLRGFHEDFCFFLLAAIGLPSAIYFCVSLWPPPLSGLDSNLLLVLRHCPASALKWI